MKIRLAIMFALALFLTGMVATPLVIAGTIELPKDLQELLPADPGALICIQSIEELDIQLADLEEAFAEEGEDEDIDLMSWITEEMPRFEEMVDLGKPLAMGVDFTPVMMGQEPSLTIIVPLKSSFTERDSVGFDMPPSGFALQGDYAALNTGGFLEPAGVSPALAQNLAPGVMTANIDLEGIISTYGAFIEMGLAAIPVGVATSDTLEDGSVVTNEGMTQEEADALTEMVRALTSSAKRMDIGFGSENGQVALDMRLDVLPGSPLAPGPQPDFDQALQLTRLLPDGEDFLMALAMDMTPQFNVFKDFYLLNMRREVEKLDPEMATRYTAWFEDYLGAIDLWALPMAANYRFVEDGMIAHMALESPDAPADQARLVALLEGLSDVDMGLTLIPAPAAEVDGVEIQSWTLSFDPNKMLGFTGSPSNPSLSGMGRMQGEQMTAVLQRIVPAFSVCARGDYLMIAADNDPTGLAGMIQAAGKKKGDPAPEAARVAKAAGPGVAEVVTGDLMSVLTYLTEFMEEVDDAEWDAIQGNPIPFDGAYTIEGDRFGFSMNMDVAAMQDLIRALDEMDLDEQFEDEAIESDEYDEEEMIIDEEDYQEDEG